MEVNSKGELINHSWIPLTLDPPALDLLAFQDEMLRLMCVMFNIPPSELNDQTPLC